MEVGSTLEMATGVTQMVYLCWRCVSADECGLRKPHMPSLVVRVEDRPVVLTAISNAVDGVDFITSAQEIGSELTCLRLPARLRCWPIKFSEKLHVSSAA